MPNDEIWTRALIGHIGANAVTPFLEYMLGKYALAFGIVLLS